MATARQVASNLVPDRRHWLDSGRVAAYVIGSALLAIAVARNTVTEVAQRFWGASGSFWQGAFDAVRGFFGDEDMTVCVIGTTVVTFSVYWLYNILLILLDLTERPRWLTRYKVQPDKNSPLCRRQLAKAIGVVLFNQLVVGGPLAFVMFLAFRWRGCAFSGELPAFQWVICEIAVFVLVEEVFFYYSHRLLHHPSLYRHIHKLHHEWTAPIGIISLYAHPLEHVLSNLLPPFVGPLLLGSHLGTVWLWYCLALMSTSNAHSGYHFPLLPSPEAHDFHHLKFVNNFGVLGVLDSLHGTDKQFRASKAYQRHFLLLSLVPVRQIVPDFDKKAASQQ